MSDNQRDPDNPGQGELSFRIVDKGKDFLIGKKVGESCERLKDRIIVAVNDYIRVHGGSVDLIQPEEIEYVRERIPGKAKGLDFDSVR